MMPDSVRQRLEALMVPLLVLSAAIFLYHFVKDNYEELFLNPVHFFDDAYMFIRYAKIWHLGYGESWNIGEGPVYGNTSQLHFLIVLLLTSFPSLTDDQVIKISSFVPALVFMLWLPWFCERHSRLFQQHGGALRYVLWCGLACPFMACFTAFGYHSLTGMDTSLSILLHLLLIDTVLSYRKQHARWQVAAMVVLTELNFLTRPENLLTSVLLVVLFLLVVQRDRRAFAIWACGTALVLAADSVAKYCYFGEVLPLAFYAKQAGFVKGNQGAGFSHPLFYFFYFLSSLLPLLALQAISLNRRSAVLQICLVIPAVATLVYFFTMMTVMNQYGRYFYPFIPYFIAAVIVSFDRDSVQFFSPGKSVVFVLCYVVCYVAISLADQHRGDIVNAVIGDLHLCDDSLKDPAADFGGIGYRVDTDGFFHMVELLKDAPSGTSAVMTEHGRVGSQLVNIRIIDITGLHSPYVARHGFSASWMYAQKPDVIWLPHWYDTCMIRDILGDAEFRQHYRFYPGLFTWGIALRSDGEHYSYFHDRLDSMVSSLYPQHHLPDFEKTW